MIISSVGVGTDKDSYKAGREACTQAMSGIPADQKINLLIVFGSTSYDQDRLVAGVSETIPDALLIGCSSAGEISSQGFSTEKSVVVMAIATDQMRFWGSMGNHILWNPQQAGDDYANTLQYESHGYVTSSLVFVDVLSGGGDKTLLGVTTKLGDDFPLFGGAATDDLLFFETYQYYQGKAYKGSIVGVGISGDYLAVGVSGHGFLPIGMSRKVTKSEGTTLFELDEKPASSIYKDYLGEEYSGQLHDGLLPSLAISYPLGIYSQQNNNVVLRNPIFVDQKGSMTFTAEIPPGSEIRLMISDIEQGLETTKTIAEEVLAKLGGRQPKAVVVINSISRKKMLGPHVDEEIELIQRIFGRDVPLIGFYSYAQIDKQPSEETPLHNGSLLIWALAE